MKDGDRWNNLKLELKSALNLWEDLCQKDADVLSLEEKKIQELKILLNDLKNKINELSEP